MIRRQTCKQKIRQIHDQNKLSKHTSTFYTPSLKHGMIMIYCAHTQALRAYLQFEVTGTHRSALHSPFSHDTCMRGACSTCGRKSKRSKAFIGPGGFGWTHWDFCVKQPAVRPNLLSGQPQLPVPMPRVRTLHGCACKLPFKYAPASGCKVSSEAEDVCLKKGGYMMSGYCVLCEVKEYTECVRCVAKPSAPQSDIVLSYVHFFMCAVHHGNRARFC